MLKEYSEFPNCKKYVFALHVGFIQICSKIIEVVKIREFICLFVPTIA
jgi:hypothetical protein